MPRQKKNNPTYSWRLNGSGPDTHNLKSDNILIKLCAAATGARRATGHDKLTTQRSHRLVSLAVRRVTLAGAMSGGACSVSIFLEGWLGGLVPTMFT